MASVVDLAQAHLAALFVHDERGRLVRINEPAPTSPAPRFFMTRTTQGNWWRVRFDVCDEFAEELNRLAGDEPVVEDLRTPPRYEARYLDLLVMHAPAAWVDAGPAYVLPEIAVPERAVTITRENIRLAERYFGWLQDELDTCMPVAAVVEDGAAVAVCFSSRLTAAVAEAGVNTEAAYRRRGYAVDAVRGWAAHVRTMGRLPLYSTSWKNSASQAVARKLGAVQYAADFSIT